MLPTKTPVRIIFGNTVNHLMVTVPTIAHSFGLSAISPRKMWLANEGDLVIVSGLINKDFKLYVGQTLGIDANKLKVLSVNSSNLSTLANSLREREVSFIKEIYKFINDNTSVTLLCYALDISTWEFTKNLGVFFDGYNQVVPFDLVKQIYNLNLKSGFRNLAAKLGLRTVPGVFCEGSDFLKKVSTSFLNKYEKVIVKLDRSSNGYGHLILSRNDNLYAVIDSYIQNFAEQPQEFIVERFIPFVSVPSIEMIIESSNIDLYYICDQRCRNHSFSGMRTGFTDLPEHIINELLSAGKLLGNYLYNLGYRGIFDIDAGVTKEGELFFTESNIRRTGGTYLHELVCKLVGKNYLRDRVWVSDTRTSKYKSNFKNGYSALIESDIAFSHKRRKGVILVADTIELDSKWRYLVIASDSNEAQFLEDKLGQILQFKDL